MTTNHAYLTETGRVVRKVYPATDPGHRRAGVLRSANDETVVARVQQVTTRYNLRRTFVVRQWVVLGLRDQSKATGRTRAEAVAAYMADLRAQRAAS